MQSKMIKKLPKKKVYLPVALQKEKTQGIPFLTQARRTNLIKLAEVPWTKQSTTWAIQLSGKLN